MPIYDYRCDECGHVFSAVQSYSESVIEVCPSCGKRPRRLISMPAIVFKGGGWYKTDSRGAAPKESQDGSGAGATGDTKSDSKTDKPSEAKSEKGTTDSKAGSKTEGSAPATKSPPKAPDTAKSETKS